MRAARILTEAHELAIFDELKDHLSEYHLMSVADASGVHFTTLYGWLNGRIKQPKLATVIKVAGVIGLEPTLQPLPRPQLRVVK